MAETGTPTPNSFWFGGQGGKSTHPPKIALPSSRVSGFRSNLPSSITSGIPAYLLTLKRGGTESRNLCNLLKRWSGRPGSNRRRPAWENDRRLKIKDHGVHGGDTDLWSFSNLRPLLFQQSLNGVETEGKFLISPGPFPATFLPTNLDARFRGLTRDEAALRMRDPRGSIPCARRAD